MSQTEKQIRRELNKFNSDIFLRPNEYSSSNRERIYHICDEDSVEEFLEGLDLIT